MTFNIINVNYVYEHISFKVWRFIAIVYGIYLMYSIMENDLESINTYNDLFVVFSATILGIGVVFGLLGSFVYSRYGQFTFDDGRFHIFYDELKAEYDMNKLEQVVFGEFKMGFYCLKFGNVELDLEIPVEELSSVKTYLTEHNVVIMPLSPIQRLIIHLKRLFRWRK